MAKFRLCSIENCSNHAYKRGWCRNHHGRFYRHGDPLGGRLSPTPIGVPLRWLRSHVSYGEDKCLIWPFKFAVSPKVWFEGKMHVSARLMCTMAHGKPPTPAHEAAHSCGNGHEGCVNQKHLRWATHKENEADKLLHGTVMRGTKQGSSILTEETVLAICAKSGSTTQRQIALEFGISQQHVSDIINKRRWHWL